MQISVRNHSTFIKEYITTQCFDLWPHFWVTWTEIENIWYTTRADFCLVSFNEISHQKFNIEFDKTIQYFENWPHFWVTWPEIKKNLICCNHADRRLVSSYDISNRWVWWCRCYNSSLFPADFISGSHERKSKNQRLSDYADQCLVSCYRVCFRPISKSTTHPLKKSTT